MREGPRSIRLGLKGIPAASESICVGRDVEVAAITGALGLSDSQLHEFRSRFVGSRNHLCRLYPFVTRVS